MRSTNTFGIHFICRMNKAKGTQVPVYCRISVDGRRIELSLRHSVDIQNWDHIKGKAKGNTESVKSLNHHLEEVRAKLVSCYQELQLQQQQITADAIKNMFLGVNQNSFTLKEAVDYHLEYMKSTLTWGTQKNYYTTHKYIDKFLREEYKRTDISLSELSFRFITQFELFLRNHQPEKNQRPLSNNGVMKHIERLRKIINLAVKLSWLEKDPFAAYRQKFHKVEKQFLTNEELQAIENKEFTIFRLQCVRDLFVFSCYTGLAYSDAINLTSDNITKGIDGEYWINTSRQKTQNPVRVPLLPKAYQIIEKYQLRQKAVSSGFIFPRLSNQKVNSYLKEIADLSNIHKNLTFHLARHTFATTVTLTNGVPIESVSKMLGHSSINTTQIYAKVIERKLSEDMQKLRSKLSEA